MIYTSYFAQLKNLPDNIVPVSICGKAPNWYTGLQYKKLAPKYDFFQEWKKNHDNDYYVKCYKEQILDKLDILTVMRNLIDLLLSDGSASGCTIALICYEKPNDFCHRHLVADWFNENRFLTKEWDSKSYIIKNKE